MVQDNLTTRIEDRDGVQVVHVSGPLGFDSYYRFKEFMDPLMEAPGGRVVLDCGDLGYVNSKGFVLLARYQRLAGQTGSFFGIAALNSRLAREVALLGLGRLVKTYATVEEAVAAAGGGR
ncbi:MAG: STAS domain-containing protein [Kiritimatiellia bacterium]